MRHRLLLALPLPLLLLTACADPGGIAPRESLRDPAPLHVAAVPAPWPSADWWRGLNDPQLDRLIAHGLADNPTLHLAEARLRRAQSLAGMAEAALAPQVTAAGSAVEQRFPANGIYPPPYAANIRSMDHLGLDGAYDLDLWGGDEARLRQALGEARAGAVEVQAARLDLAAAMAQAYVRLADAYDQRDLDRALLAQKRRIAALAGQRAQAGLDSDIAAREAEADSAALEAGLTAADARIVLLGQQLAVLAGQNPDQGRAITRPALSLSAAVGLPTTLSAALIGRRPDVVAQRWRVEAAEQGVKAAHADFYPDLKLTAFVGLDSIGIDNFLMSSGRDYGVGPAVTLPIFDGGRLRAALGAAAAGRDMAVDRYNATVLAALEDVVGRLTAWQANETALAQEQAATAQREQAWRLAGLRYRQGLVNDLAVLEAEGRLTEQKRRLLDARNQRYALAIALAHALGGGYAPHPAAL